MICTGLMRVVKSITVASALFAMMLLCGTAFAATTTFSYLGPPVPIPDAADLTGTNPGAQVGAPITVSGLAGSVASLTMSIDGTVCSAVAGSVTVGLDHTFVNDLVITLSSPGGAQVVVINQTDGGGNNFCQVVLDDTAATSIQTAVTADAPFTGTWQPASLLSAFAGEAPNGTWTLLAQDFFAADTGNIRAWSITITDNSAPTASSVTITGTPGVGAILTGSYTYADIDGDLEGATTFRWMSDTVNTGVTMTPIVGATALTYSPQSTDVGRFLFFCVTPAAGTGTSPGTEVCSLATPAVFAAAVATPVPTLSEWAMIMMSLMLGAAALYRLRFNSIS